MDGPSATVSTEEPRRPSSGCDVSDDASYDLDAGPDPADYAAATPEPACADDDGRAVHAAGVGPENPEYLVAQAERAI